MATKASRTVLVSGACGNLGRKLIDHLAGRDWCAGAIGIDRETDPAMFARHGSRVRLVRGDLRDGRDRRWIDALEGVDAVAHFAAQVPGETADWTDVAASIDMSINLLEASAEAGARRFVFATSNHVMGGYKDPPLADAVGPGQLTTAIAPAPGTLVRMKDRVSDSTPYAVAKLVGERLCVGKALATGGKLSAVAVRIGWCQPGANDPRTINLDGIATSKPRPPANADEERTLRWFRNMWLSNRDFLDLMEKALTVDRAAWPAPGIVVNGMSANRGMGWDIETTRRLLGYAPQDDLWAHVS